MLFNSYLFLLLFLPVALAGHYISGAINLRLAAFWLCLTSFVFYGWWNPQFVVLLAISIAFNYAISQGVLRNAGRVRVQNAIVALGVGVDLAVLFHYKYFAALLGFLHDLGLTHSTIDTLVLPLGISFFTFTQIGYLLDCRSGLVKERSLLSYVLFVTFFPHLIAGPILHHKEMMPQFAQRENYRFKAENLSIGGILFVIGLAKKVLLADAIAPYADAGFASPGDLQFWGAWGTSLCYALQVYFDFSGYSDMALGLAKMFGIRFPLNFNSPYKATSVIDFWARWHITLTRYLTAYLYYPVAMAISRRRSERGLPGGSEAARTPSGFLSTIVVPTVFTMGLAGVWHGAGFQFLVFGLLHAAYLSINHGWRIFVVGRKPASRKVHWPSHIASVALTFVAVLVAQAFFRANGVHDALSLLGGMVGLRGVEAWPSLSYLDGTSLGDGWRLLIGHHLQLAYVVVLLGIVWFTPNAHQILGRYSPALFKVQEAARRFMRWQPNPAWLSVTLALLFLCLVNLHKETRFLYFQF
ncbi:MBOAT family O-acyltransferase [Pandoraea apista]|uniref:Probable alginate O-acetylase AlgI n=2 Tax=Pandoraea apista TaxID=93218 RepID=A0ABX9ZVG0_9BURK|nr:MBOAT family O-acyltransferase [Pandoraea apista]RRJ31304.1 MBOAT family protein [Pandoraea apista]RRJ73070.1 MBOAT family protein [Pandoraea apista]RSD08762.1 MBOAT family protein [Pandoraea apista]RSD20439.1 MBOAT family protein [Pandoraea apista]RSK81270.1 MBOAT family protein [Pandoraea apista]